MTLPAFSSQASSQTPLRFHINAGGVRLAATAWGDPAHPVVVLVHGYPDNSRVWQGVAQSLAERFFVVAYDVRGAGQSDAPPNVADYRLGRLADDGVHGLRLYRANFRARLRAPRERRAHAPVQIIVPTRDRYVRPALTENLEPWVAHLWRRQIEAHHWLPLSHPKRMAAMICEFVDHLNGAPASAALQAARVSSEAANFS